jgi:hypothetical protein
MVIDKKWFVEEAKVAFYSYFMPVIFPWMVLTQGWTKANGYFEKTLYSKF